MKSRTLSPFRTTNLVVVQANGGASGSKRSDCFASGDALLIDPGCSTQVYTEVRLYSCSSTYTQGVFLSSLSFKCSFRIGLVFFKYVRCCRFNRSATVQAPSLLSYSFVSVPHGSCSTETIFFMHLISRGPQNHPYAI